MSEFGQSIEESIFAKAAEYFHDIPETFEANSKRFDVFGLKINGQRRAALGHEYRPRQVGAVDSASHTTEELQFMRRNYERLQSKMNAMPGGAPQTIEDMKKVLPHVDGVNRYFHLGNPAGRWANCVECSMAVDDIQRGRAAVAGNSTYVDNIAGIPMSTPTAIEQATFHAGPGARGVVLLATSHGSGHMCNIRNFGGKVWWIDGQTNTVADSFDKFSYLDEYETYTLNPTGGGSL